MGFNTGVYTILEVCLELEHVAMSERPKRRDDDSQRR